VNVHILAGTVSDVILDETLSLAMKKVSMEMSTLTASVPLIGSLQQNRFNQGLVTQ